MIEYPNVSMSQFSIQIETFHSKYTKQCLAFEHICFDAKIIEYLHTRDRSATKSKRIYMLGYLHDQQFQLPVKWKNIRMK